MQIGSWNVKGQSFYTFLYAAETIDPSQAKHFLNSAKLPQISSEQLLALNAPIAQTEIEEAFKTLASNKSLGLDGLSGEFYKLTREFIPQTLNKVFNGKQKMEIGDCNLSDS